MKRKLKPFQVWLFCAAVLRIASSLNLSAAPANFTDANWISMGGLPGANGVVYAAAVDGSGSLYVGGSFTAIGDIPASYIAKWDGSRWKALSSGMSSYVLALAVSGSEVYAAGYFTN